MSEPDFRFVVSKTPLRITFTGGGTDLPQYYRKHGPGAIVSAAINKYIFVTVSKHFHRDELRISYSKTENAIKNVEDIEHPTVREALKMLDIKSGIQITSITEIPSQGTGVGSSSTFLVGLLNALHGWLGETISPKQLAEEAVHIEREVLKEPGGKQDQYIAAYGGIKLMEFNSDDTVSIKPALLDSKQKLELNRHLLLLYTGNQRVSTSIHVKQEKEVESHLQEYDKMRNLAYQTYDSLSSGRWNDIGRLLDENWSLKKNLASGISTNEIDRWYETAKRAGAVGGKVIGAGGGGFMLFFADPDKHDKIRKALPGLQEEPFRFEMEGSKIVHTEA
ncbi:MAG: kinase [Candidatus Micrarchaeota archaeon]|nr:kinase [Candidatus Micrarchaeota archaeon]MDE1824320.1 kinase [Candidatus Micrarchaeota archaeon]MDE1850006.1 kinase [Candidatus Micrarchaeota archaeon]